MQSSLVFGHDKVVWDWAGKNFTDYFDHTQVMPTWAVGIINDQGVLRGALIGAEESPSTVEFTIYSEGAVTLPIARQFFTLVFDRYWRLQVRTTKDNKSVKRNAPKWGFTFEGTAKDFWGPGRSALLYRMLKPDCRFIKMEHAHEIA
jgi:hypothetical protein